MNLIKYIPDSLTDDTTLAVHRSVLFLIHSFKFSLEEAENRINEAIGFNNRPLFQAVSGEIDLINRFLHLVCAFTPRPPIALYSLSSFIGDAGLWVAIVPFVNLRSVDLLRFLDRFRGVCHRDL